MFHNQEIIDYIQDKLLLTWSPDEIANTPCELKIPTAKTIYRWIYEKYIPVNLKVLRQKGTNENLDGLLREFYPKGRILSRVSPTTLKKNLALINARPKKILNYQKLLHLV